jgi:hypothetical protein
VSQDNGRRCRVCDGPVSPGATECPVCAWKQLTTSGLHRLTPEQRQELERAELEARRARYAPDYPPPRRQQAPEAARVPVWLLTIVGGALLAAIGGVSWAAVSGFKADEAFKVAQGTAVEVPAIKAGNEEAHKSILERLGRIEAKIDSALEGRHK